MSKSNENEYPTWFWFVMSFLVLIIIGLIVLIVRDTSAKKQDMLDAGLNQELQIVFTDSREIASQKKLGSLVILSNGGLVKDQPARVILTDFSGRSTEFVFTPIDVIYEISDDINVKNSVELSSFEGWYYRDPLKQKLEEAEISVKLHLYSDVYDAIYGK